MKVKVLRGFSRGNGVDVNPGDIIEMPDREAAIKIKQGKVRDTALPERQYTRNQKPAEHKDLLFPLKEALELIAAAATAEEVDELIMGDTRKQILQAAEARKKELTDKEGGDKDAEK